MTLRRFKKLARRALAPLAAATLVTGLTAQVPSASGADLDPSPQTTTYSTYGSKSISTTDGNVLVRYPTTSGAIAPRRPVVLVGHGMGMDPNAALSGHQYLVNAGYVVAVPPLGASTDYKGLARKVSRSLDAVLADSTLAPGILPDRIGYTGGSQGGITGIALQDPSVRDPRIKAFVIRSGRVSGSAPSWADAPPMLFMLGTADNVITPAQTRAAYDAATHPKGKIELPGAGHDMVEPKPTSIIGDSTTAFFARFLNGVSNGLDGVQAAVTKDVNGPTYVHDWTLDAGSVPKAPTPTPTPTPTTKTTKQTTAFSAKGKLTRKKRKVRHRVPVTAGRVRVVLRFTVPNRPGATATLTLRKPGGAVVATTTGKSIRRLKVTVKAGTYRVVVTTGMSLRGRDVSYRLRVKQPKKRA